MESQATDGELIGRSVDDPVAFREIFDRHYARIYRYAVRRVGPDAGEEVAAQTFEEAFRHRGRFDLTREDAAPWLFGIASHLAAHHFRSERTRFEAYAKTAIREPSSAPSPEESVEAIVALPAVTNAIAAMPPGDRDAILLFAWADLSYPEVALALDIPVGTVRSRINRVRRHLRELIDTDQAITDGGET